MIPLPYYLIVSAILFSIGTIGVLTRKNAIVIFMCVELMLNAVNLTFIALSRDLGKIDGQVFVFFIMTVAAAEGAVAQVLGIASDQLLQRSVRVRSVDGAPFSYLTTHVPESISVTFSKQELASRPLLELLERAGVKVESARQRISAILATREVAEALDVRIGSPLIELVRVSLDQRGCGVKHLHALYRPDRYAIEIELARSGAADTKAWSPVVRKGRSTHKPLKDFNVGLTSSS